MIFSITSGIVLVGVFAIYQWGQHVAKTKEAERQEKVALREAQEWANKPSTDIDTLNRLRKRIRRKNKARDKR